MRKSHSSLTRVQVRRTKAGASALIIVLCFVVLLTVVVLALLSRSIFNGLISGASTKISKTDIYGHGTVDQIIGDLEQEIVAGSANQTVGASMYTNTMGVYTNAAGVVSYIYRPAAVTNSVPYNSGPYLPGTAAWTNLPNLVKESYHGVPFEPYDSSVPQRAANAPSTTASRNGRYVSFASWNKALLLPKLSTTITTGTTGTTLAESSPTIDTTPNTNTGYFSVPPDWILTAADGSNVTAAALDTSTSTTTSNVMAKSPKYVVGRYAYTIYNEGGLLDANVAGCPSSTTFSLSAAQKAILTKKGPSAFADLTQLPGLSNLTVTSATRPQKVVDALVAWRNSATASGTTMFPYFPNYTFTASAVNSYFAYLLNLSTGFMTVGNTSYSTKGLSDRRFTSRQQMISFFQNVLAQNTTEQAYLQDSMMYLGTFSRALNQPSYWPDPGRPKVVGPASDGSRILATQAAYNNGASEYNGGNSAFGLDNIYNPPLRSIRVAATFTGNRNDGSTPVVGEPLIKKRFALSRLAWLTCDGPIATDAGTLNTSDTNINAIVTYLEGSSVGMSASFLQEGGPTNIYHYFGLKWVSTNGGATGVGNPGGYWYYDHGIQISGQTVLGALSQVAAANREPDFFELLQAGINVGGIAKLGGAIGSTPFTWVQDSTVTAQIMQVGANIIDEANPTQYPTHIVYPFGQVGGNVVLRSAYGAMDLPYLDGVFNLRFIVRPPTTAITSNIPSGTATTISTTTPSLGMFSAPEGTGAFMQVPSIWNSCDVNGPVAPTGIVPSKLRIVVSSALTALNGNLTTPTGSIGTVSSSAWPDATSGWNASGSGSGTAAVPSGLGLNPLSILPADSWTGSVPTGASANSTTVTTTNPDGSTTTATNNTYSPTGTYASQWTSELSTALTFSNVASLYREPTVLMQKGVPSSSNLTMDPGNAILAVNSNWTAGVPEMTSNGLPATSASNCSFIGFLGSTFPLEFTAPSTATAPPINYLYGINSLIPGTMPASGVTVRLEYQVGSNWVPYMEYFTSFQYTHDFVPYTEAGTTASPYELIPNNGTANNNATGSLWNGNKSASPGGPLPGMMSCWDVRSQAWGFPVDVGPARLFLDGSAGTTTTPSASDMITTLAPGATSTSTAPSPAYQTSHSSGLTMNYYGAYEPTGGVLMGTKQQNLWSSSTTTPTTDYYTDADGTVRRAIGAYVGPTSGMAGNLNGSVTWNWTANTTVGLPLAGTKGFTSGSTTYTPATNQSQARPIILHRPYRSVAELGYVFSNTPWKNIDFATPESPYSALLDIFCINEDYRPDAVTAGRVDLNSKQAPVFQALFAGAYRDEESPSTGTLTSGEAAALSQALVTRTTTGGTNPSVSLATPQPLSNIGDMVGRWISGTTVGSTAAPINGAASYDGFSANLGVYLGSPVAASQTSPLPSGNYNIIKRFRESAMRALSDAGQAGTWNLLIDVVAQSGRYPANASGLSDFLVEGERHYWVHVAIDRTTGQVIDENIETVNE